MWHYNVHHLIWPLRTKNSTQPSDVLMAVQPSSSKEMTLMHRFSDGVFMTVVMTKSLLSLIE